MAAPRSEKTISEDSWVECPELEPVVQCLGKAVAGQPDVDTGRPIGDWGVGSNTGSVFQNQTFAIRDYCWCDGLLHAEISNWQDDETLTEMPPSGGTSSGCPMNFEHFSTGLQGIWYKHLGRDPLFSRHVSAADADAILRDCLASPEWGPGRDAPGFSRGEVEPRVLVRRGVGWRCSP